MRHLLFLAHRIPFPPDKGDKIRAFHILRYLSSRYQVHLGCFIDDVSDEQYFASLREICAEVFLAPLSRMKKIMGGLQGLSLGRSITEGSYSDVAMRTWIHETLYKNDIEDVFVYCSAMAPYVFGIETRNRVVIDMVDVDSAKWDAYGREARWPLNQLYFLEKSRVSVLEKRAVVSCDRALFVSRAEVEEFLTLAPELSGRVGYLENGVDFNWFNPHAEYPNPFESCKPSIVFTGVMNYKPNIDAVVWFADEVLPSILHERPATEFWIVGAKPVEKVWRLSERPGISVTGTVPDVRPYLAHATCVVAPLRIARGVQNKVLEAMAMAKPTVLTAAALEGLSAAPGREVIVADSASGFASGVLSVLAGAMAHLGVAARKRVEMDYCWSKNLQLLDDIFLHASASKITPAAIDCRQTGPWGIVK